MGGAQGPKREKKGIRSSQPPLKQNKRTKWGGCIEQNYTKNTPNKPTLKSKTNHAKNWHISLLSRLSCTEKNEG